MTKKKLSKEWNIPDPTNQKLEKLLDRSWKFIKKESIRSIRWLFFYQPESKFMANIHIFDIIILVYLVFRLAKIQ